MGVVVEEDEASGMMSRKSSWGEDLDTLAEEVEMGNAPPLLARAAPTTTAPLLLLLVLLTILLLLLLVLLLL